MKASRIVSRNSTGAASSWRCLHQHPHQHLAQPTSHSTPSTTTPSPFSSSTQRRTLYNTTTQPAARRSKSALSNPQHQHRPQQRRPISTTLRTLKGIQPDSADPAPPNTAPSTSSTSRPIAAEISESEYHEIADEYLDTLVYAAEELSESVENGIDVEYSAGVLTIIHPTQGSYVINKQPPNKQIWLSSPVSGPKRYDWVVAGKDAAQHEKEGSVLLDDPEAAGDDGAGGKWIYIRDGSGLSDLLKSEIGVTVVKPPGGDD